MAITSPEAAYSAARSGIPFLEKNLTDHFAWAEVFRNCTPESIQEAGIAVFHNAFRLASVLEQVRGFFNAPVCITCWYRDPAHNEAAGGVQNSQHLYGDAADFTVFGVPSDVVYRKLDPLPLTKLCGLGEYKAHCHLDVRGTHARWQSTNA